MSKRKKLPNCLDKSVKITDEVYMVIRPVIRHMTPSDLEQILDEYDITFKDKVFHEINGKIIPCRGKVDRLNRTMEISYCYDIPETLLHEAVHVFYGSFAAEEYGDKFVNFEPNVIRWSKMLEKDSNIKKVLQNYIISNIPTNLYWEIPKPSKLLMNIENLVEGMYDLDDLN